MVPEKHEPEVPAWASILRNALLEAKDKEEKKNG